MKLRKISCAVVGIILILGLFGTIFIVRRYIIDQEIRQQEVALNAAIDAVISARLTESATSTDPFGDDDVVSILLVGLDTRSGETVSHCDAIQFVEINRAQETIHITAVPRGTYAALPPGTGTTSSDYYVSNSCALGGLDFGIEQIEKILGKQADYIAVIGFSELVGALRTLRLPMTDTVEWLRHRQGYAIGEPQRAHNHSTFIKQMLIRFTPTEIRTADRALHYILYSFINTDLSFTQAKKLLHALVDMRISERPEIITLSMRPVYDVQDIEYDETTAGSYVQGLIVPISHYLNPKDYSQLSESDITEDILELIATKQDDLEFIRWAWDHKLWYQIYKDEQRLQTQYDLLFSYLGRLESTEARQAVLGDYVLEMDFLGHDEWKTKGEALIVRELD